MEFFAKTRLRVTVALVGLYFSFNAIAQPIIMGNKLNGESVVSTIQYKNSSNEDASIVTTSTSAYINEDLQTLFLPGVTVSSYQRILNPPKGRTIKTVGIKKGKSPIGTMVDKELLFLMDNGDVYRYDIFNGTTDSIGRVSSGGSQTWEKILGDAIYALSSSSLYVSRDNGLSWQTDNAGLGAGHIWDFDQDTTLGILYAATSTGLYKKDTLPGSTWAATTFTGTTNVFRVFIDKKNRILVGGNGGGLWISTDNGVTWTVDTAGLGTNGTLQIFTDDVFGNLYGVNTGTKKIYRSNNGNQPWQLIDAGILSISGIAPSISSLAGDSIVVAGTNFGIFVTGDQGNTWFKRDSAVRTQNFYGLARLSNGKLFTSTNLGIYKNDPGDSNWTKSYPQTGFRGQVNVFSDNSDVLYGLDNSITHNNNTAIPIVKSTDEGLTWTVDTVGLSAITGNLFYIDETGTQHYSNTLFGSSFINNLWKRTPPGAWTLDNDGFAPTNNSFNSAMVSDGSGYLYISGSFSGKKLMRRPIAGGTWVVDTAGIGSSVNRFTMMTKGPNGNVIGSNGFVLKQRTGGSWNTIPIPAPLSSYIISAIAVDSSGKLFVAFIDNNNLGKGVYYATNYEANWSLVGLDSVWVTQLKAYNDTVYALSLGFGAYKLVAGAGPVLPLKLLTFSASNQGLSNLLKWKTENEYNTSHFEIERSADGSVFAKIGELGSSNTAAMTDYSFIDAIPLSGNNFYRLKMIDKDGKFSYSKVEKVYVKLGSFLKIWPNPSSGQFTISGLEPDRTYIFNVFDLQGKLVSRETATGRQSIIDLHKQSAGFYILRIDSDMENIFFKLLKN